MEINLHLSLKEVELLLDCCMEVLNTDKGQTVDRFYGLQDMAELLSDAIVTHDTIIETLKEMGFNHA